MKLLVDTCGWIDYLRNKTGALGDEVTALLIDDEAAICCVSVAELLQGVHGKKEQQALDLLLANVTHLDVLPLDWRWAGQLQNKLRAQGVNAGLTDVLIAAVAQRNGVGVLTSDRLFSEFGVPLKLILETAVDRLQLSTSTGIC